METGAAALNEFQKELSLAKIYVKNESLVPDSIEHHNSLRILTWNIERGVNPERLSAYINQVKPDVVCLQEVDWSNQRTKNVDVLDRIARSTAMLGFFGVEFFEMQNSPANESASGGGVHGNAILTRIAPKKCFRIDVPLAFDWVNPPAAKQKIIRRERRIGGRFALCAEFEYFGRSVFICSAHLEDKDGGVKGRFAQFKSVTEAIHRIEPESATSIIAGDFNTLENWMTSITRGYQDSTSLRKPWYVRECRWWREYLLPETGYADPFTCESWTYKRRLIYREKLDWIAVRNCQITARGIGNFNTSDHRPIWAQVKL